MSCGRISDKGRKIALKFKTPENKLKSSHAWKAKNKERIKEYRKQYWLENQERERQTNAEWLKNNEEEWKQKKRELDKEYNLKNQDKIKTYNQSPEVRDRINSQNKKRYNEDIAYNLEKKLRALFVQSLRAQNTKKAQSITVLIDCTVDFLKQHLENQFQSGMTWENRGRFGWHIDHIIPISSFDLTDPEEQKKCFHFSNLQPLWWNENINKSARLDWVRSLEPQLVPCVA